MQFWQSCKFGSLLAKLPKMNHQIISPSCSQYLPTMYSLSCPQLHQIHHALQLIGVRKHRMGCVASPPTAEVKFKNSKHTYKAPIPAQPIAVSSKPPVSDSDIKLETKQRGDEIPLEYLPTENTLAKKPSEEIALMDCGFEEDPSPLEEGTLQQTAKKVKEIESEEQDEVEPSLCQYELRNTQHANEPSVTHSHMQKLRGHQLEVETASNYNNDLISQMNKNSKIEVPSRVWNNKLALRSTLTHNNPQNDLRPRKFSQAYELPSRQSTQV